jgi:uncharacterized protein with NRDE domain
MCLIAWNWQPDGAMPLLLVANRDEFYARPALPLHWWDCDRILAGKDLQAGGTWLGVSRNGRLAALTNYRDPAANRPDAPSRGELVSRFLDSPMDAAGYLTQLLPTAGVYNAFNLLVYDGQTLMGMESRHARIVPLTRGIGAVSNADFHTGWPKVTALKEGLQRALNHGTSGDEELLQLLGNKVQATDSELPSTGVPVDLERGLSSVFVNLPGYGTRASSVVRMHLDHASFQERRFDVTGFTGDSALDFPHTPAV